MKKEIKIAVITSIILLMISVAVTLLVVNSTVYSNVSNDGWAGYIGNVSGSLIAAFTSFAILWITNKQTQRIEEINKKLQEDDLISNNYSEIRFNEEQEFVRKPNEDSFYIKVKLHDENRKPLIKMNIDKIEFLRSKNSFYGYEEYERIELCKDVKDVSLEYTPKQEMQNVKENFYFGWVKLNKNMDDILESDLFYKLAISMSVINIFGVEIKQTYYLLIGKVQNKIETINGKIRIIPETQLNGSGDYYHLRVNRQFTNFEEIKYHFIDEK